MASKDLDRLKAWRPHMVVIPRTEFILDSHKTKGYVLTAALIINRVLDNMVHQKEDEEGEQ